MAERLIDSWLIKYVAEPRQATFIPALIPEDEIDKINQIGGLTKVQWNIPMHLPTLNLGKGDKLSLKDIWVCIWRPDDN